MFKTTGVSALGVSVGGLINQWSIQLFNVPLTVVGMTVAGTLLSFGYGPKIENRKNLYLQALFIAFLSTVTVAIVPEFMDWEWVTPKLQAPLGGMLAVLGRFTIDPAIKIIPEVLRKIFRLDKKDETS